MKSMVTLLAAGFLLVYVGVEVSIGGWIVVFMRNVRHGEPFEPGTVSTGFWLVKTKRSYSYVSLAKFWQVGVVFDRLILGFVTPCMFSAERYAVATYIAISIALELMFWVIPNFLVSAVVVRLLGLFLAPLFPAAVVAITKLLPKSQSVAAVGFAAALGASGACVFPFAAGAIANAKAVQVLQLIILAMLVVMLGVMVVYSSIAKDADSVLSRSGAWLGKG